MKEIREAHLANIEVQSEKKRIAQEKYSKAFERVRALKEKLEKAEVAEMKADKAVSKIRMPSIYDGIIEPLAKKLSEHFGMPYEIFGPFGLECETTIYLRKDMNLSICDQPTISLVLRPDFDENWIAYNTGEKVMRYPKGSVGDMNGYNDVYALLPVEFEEILKLVTNDFEKGEESNG